MRKLCWFALPFCAALFAVQYVLDGVLILPLAGIMAALALPAAFLRRARAALACLGFVLGLLWFEGYTLLFHAPAEQLDGTVAPFDATVTDWPYETAIGGSGVLVRLHVEGAPDVKTLLYTGEEGMTLAPGDRVSGIARYDLADVVRGETVTYYEAKGVFLRAFASGTMEREPTGSPPPWSWPAYVARALKQSVQVCFPADMAGFFNALVTGDRSDMDDGEYMALQRAGLSHIVAVSGMHLTFFAGMLTTLLSKRRPRVRACAVIAVIFFFAAVTGNTPSVLRAAMMQSITLLVPLLGREEDKPTTLAFILTLLLAVNPYSAASVSLQLSFGSVAGIYLVSLPLYRRMTRGLPESGAWYCRAGRRVACFLWANLSTTLGAMVFTVPLTALHFGTVSLISPLANLATLWAVSYAFILGLAAAAVGIFLPGAGALIALPAAWLGRFVLAGAEALSAPAFSSISVDSFYLRMWLVLVYLILLLCLLRRQTARPILPVCAGTVTLCLALLLTRWSAWSGALTVTVLDVGQGQCVLFSSGGRTALVDCGGSGDNAGDVAADYLQTLGVSRLDLLILTHYHDDHANGVPELFARLDISALAVPDVEEESGYRGEIESLARSAGTEITYVTENLAVTLGESVLTLYAPLGDGDANEEGLFVLGTCGEFDVLITGDANEHVEQRLVKYGNLPQVELLVAGHHGSKAATSDVLLDAITPETVVISSGWNNYGHPAPETLARLAAREIEIYRTDWMGDVSVRVRGEAALEIPEKET